MDWCRDNYSDLVNALNVTTIFSFRVDVMSEEVETVSLVFFVIDHLS